MWDPESKICFRSLLQIIAKVRIVLQMIKQDRLMMWMQAGFDIWIVTSLNLLIGKF
jgi:hypothetical protein